MTDVDLIERQMRGLQFDAESAVDRAEREMRGLPPDWRERRRARVASDRDISDADRERIERIADRIATAVVRALRRR